jgi:iron complex transport system permease protein
LFLALFAGAALECSGAVYQSVFRNSLATPFTLGTASGGAFGAVLAIKAGLVFTVLGVSSVTAAAFAGSLVSLFIVYLLGRHRGGITTSTMLLSGVTVGFFFSAMTMFVHYLMDPSQSYRVVLWTMGSLDITDYGPVLRIAPVVVVCLGGLFLMGRQYNQLCLGDEIARARGVRVERVKNASFLLTSVLVGASVSVAGPIVFVGLIVPHTFRMIIGSDYRILLPATAIGGGAFLVLCDTIARTLLSPAEIPVGVITAMLGGPFFLFLLLRKSPEEF